MMFSPRRFIHWLSLCLGSFVALGSALAMAADTDLEAKVKSAYLFHLTKFVDWPNLPADSVRICIVGSDSIGSQIGELGNRTVREHPLRIEVDNITDPARCQVLFIGRGEKRSSELLARVRGQGVLTVGERDDFARTGGVVGFYLDAGKVKLEINPEAARQANLRISSKLLEVARQVNGAN